MPSEAKALDHRLVLIAALKRCATQNQRGCATRSRSLSTLLGVSELQVVGSSKENTEPRPSWLVTLIAPLWASTIALAMAKPMPVPCTR